MNLKNAFLVMALCLNAACAGPSSLDLAGSWRLQLDPQDEGLAAQQWQQPFADTMTLPGTTALAGKGEPLVMEPNLERPCMQHLQQRFRYVGPAWYQRTVSIPADWRDQDITLTLERVIWETRVWVNGVEAGAPELSLTTPHRYDLTALLKPGTESTLTLRVDNREKVSIGIMGHAYTDETQTLWNGVVGELQLEAKPKLRVESLRLRPDLTREGVAVTVELINHTGARQSAELSLRASPIDLTMMSGEVTSETVEVPPGRSTRELFHRMVPFLKWSEFTPHYYALTAMLQSGGQRSEFSDTFGMREFKAAGTQFTINGQPTFLRGDLECAIFPQTGHPDMTGEQWEKIFITAKAHGLNHLRFHSWCPPEIAFELADRHGFYLQVELPNWTFEMGQNPQVDDWLRDEGERMLCEYANHPSFVMLSLGNELKGDLGKMDQLIDHFRAIEPDLLYTSTSYAFSPRGRLPGRADDYFISQQTDCGWVRGQGFLNNTKPSTDSDYAAGRACIKVPLVTHEVGQYVVYPNLAELPKYDSTPLRATAWEAIQADLKSKGRLDEAARYTRDSGKLAALLYREDLERALRTPGLAGIQLLQLQDFPGQSTATVGLLDSFWDSKGAISAEDFRKFCAPTVALARMKQRVWKNTESFEATLEAAHFGESARDNVRVIWALLDGAQTVDSDSLTVASLPLGNGIPLGSVRVPLATVTQPARLTLQVAIPSLAASNSWSVWVYPKAWPAEESGNEFLVSRGVNPETLDALAAGKTVLLLPPAGAVKVPIPGRFIPVFWSPLHFPNQPGTLGATIDTTHPLWKAFPTDTHTDWHWWELTAESVAVDLDGLDPAIAAPFRFIDKYNRNALPAALFEAKVGAGKLLVCTLDVDRDLENRIVARQLRRALFEYAGSGFKPAGRLTREQLQRLIGETDLLVTADSQHASHPAAFAADGDPATLWHSDWTAKAKLPLSFTLDLITPKLIAGFDYLPRRDSANGRIKDYAVQVSVDGNRWLDWGVPGSFPNTKDLQPVRFEKPVQARFLRVKVLSDHSGGGYASAAELKPVLGDPGDVRELGIIPGFNDK